MNIQGIIFDLDGTLIDSRRDLVESVGKTLARLGADALPEDIIASYVGDGVLKLLAGCLAHSKMQDRAKDGVEVFMEIYGQHLLDHTALYPGVQELLEGLKGKRMAVLSNKPEGLTLRILEGLGVRPLFDPVLGGDSLPVKKPDPAPVAHVLQRWGMPPAQAVVVGDSPNDMLAGKRAGTLCCAVSYGFRSREELVQTKPDWIIANPLALQDLI